MTLLSVSCRHKMENGEVRAFVEEINDSVMITKIDGSKVNFDITVASFTHGAVMYGDSVIINYVGDLSKKRALAKSVFLIERPGKIMEFDRNAEPKPGVEMMTRPAAPDVVKETDRAIRAAQKYAK